MELRAWTPYEKGSTRPLLSSHLLSFPTSSASSTTAPSRESACAALDVAGLRCGCIGSGTGTVRTLKSEDGTKKRRERWRMGAVPARLGLVVRCPRARPVPYGAPRAAGVRTGGRESDLRTASCRRSLIDFDQAMAGARSAYRPHEQRAIHPCLLRPSGPSMRFPPSSPSPSGTLNRPCQSRASSAASVLTTLSESTADSLRFVTAPRGEVLLAGGAACCVNAVPRVKRTKIARLTDHSTGKQGLH
ncbi:hypothetical protein C8R45DRAFT_1215122 [Mycena sanguinolenta]|nr:hypothetical protein C8R45DRAFT_1215122 [Mycena sanguinolenta]